jgi:alpha-N-arabinofuranosidase
MTAEFYTDQYRRYATYVRNANRDIYKIAGGANVADYHWTEVLMRDATRLMDGMSIHYYTRVAKDWNQKGSATEFDEAEWFSVLENALYMDELVTKHGAIMDRYDPEKRVGMVVDEWGTWFSVEPGTNPRFLYQQNSIRDALVAGIHLNIFNNHSDRVRMANLAQTVNVLQSVILTEGERMVLTPTYHVFDMFKVHQGATLLPVLMDGGEYCLQDKSIPRISASASVDAAGAVHLSLCNLSHDAPAEVDALIRGCTAARVTGTVLTAETIQAHNTFDDPDHVRPVVFEGARLDGERLTATLPPRSVTVLELV